MVCTGLQYQTTETAGSVFNGSCTNNAGLTTTPPPLTIKLDKTPPTVSFNGDIQQRAELLLWLRSGPAPTAPPLMGSPADSLVHRQPVTARRSARTRMTATATDVAGNSYRDALLHGAGWTLTGFYQPVDMNGVSNAVKGGSTVPLKFEIFAGPTELTDTAIVKS